MFDQLTGALDFHGKALTLRAERQRTIASNIANADTPGYTARDLNFRDAMAKAKQPGALAMQLTAPRSGSLSRALDSASLGSSHSNARHMALNSTTGELGNATPLAYTTQTQPSMDGNSVDLDRERANFVDNAVRYESTLRFINGHSRTILSAITGQ